VQTAVEWLVAACFFVVGLSHILQPGARVEFFHRFREKGAVGSFAAGPPAPSTRALDRCLFHNVWRGLPLVVTLIGWSQLLKSFLYLGFPGHGLRMLGYISIERSWRFVVAGFFHRILSADRRFASHEIASRDGKIGPANCIRPQGNGE
jgi:hypothetical protein